MATEASLLQVQELGHALVSKVTAQMILDLIILGVGAKIILGTVQRTKERLTSQTSAEPASP